MGAAILVFYIGPGGAVAGGSERREAGTVHTLAGPGFCEGLSSVDPASRNIGPLAAGRGGEFYFATGRAHSGFVTRVDENADAHLIRTGLFSPGKLLGGEDRIDPKLSITLASAPNGGAYASNGKTIFHITGLTGISRIAGADPASPPQPGRGPGVPGSALDTQFREVRGLASDEAGNLFVAEGLQTPQDGGRIWFLNRGTQPATLFPGTPDEVQVQPGHLGVIAGGDAGAQKPDSTSARTASIRGEKLSMSASSGKLYVAASDSRMGSGSSSAAVRVINLTGDPLEAHGSTIAPAGITGITGGRSGFGGDGGPAKSARFSVISGVSADPAGGLYIADEWNHRIRRIDSGGRVTTVAGTGRTGKSGGGFNGNDRQAKTSLLNRPVSVQTGARGAVLVADRLNQHVRVIDNAGRIRAAPGAGTSSESRCKASAEGPRGFVDAPRGGSPIEVTAASNGDLFFIASDLRQVKRLRSSGIVSTVEVPLRDCLSRKDCREKTGARAAPQFDPVALTVRAREQGLYVMNRFDHRVRLLNFGSRPFRAHGLELQPGAVRTVAGNGRVGVGTPGEGEKATRVPVSGVNSIAADRHGNLLLAQSEQSWVRQVDSGGRITTLVRPEGSLEGTKCCHIPAALIPDSSGNLYIGNSIPSQVWFFNRGDLPVMVHGVRVKPGSINVIAGTGKPGFAGDGGPALQAELEDASALAVDGRGSLFISGSLRGNESSVRRVDRAGTIETLAGRGSPGFNGDGLKARLTSLSRPGGIALDRCGDLVIADTGNDRLRLLYLNASCTRQTGEQRAQEEGRSPWAWVAFAAGAAGLAALLLRKRSTRSRFAPSGGPSQPRLREVEFPARTVLGRMLD